MAIKKVSSLLNVAFIALLFIPAAHAAAPAAPDFELPAVAGTVSLAGLKNKVVYLDFWASWCPPCLKSFPWMNEMARRYGSQGLVVVAVNLDKERGLAEQFLRGMPAMFTVVYDPEGTVAEKYGVQGMPSSYIINRDGKIIQTHLGFRPDDAAALEKSLKSALEN